MYYFDCCCEIGPRHGKDPVAPWTVDDALRWMDHCGIDGALVCHTLSTQYDPVWARQRMAREIDHASDRLFPVWDLLPPDAGDFDRDPAMLLDAMGRSRVRAVRLSPKAHAYPFLTVLLAPQLAVLEEQGILILIDYGELPDGHTAAFATMDDLLRTYPRLNVLLRKVSWSCQRVVAALMDRHPNLHIEFSTFQINRGIEMYTPRFGEERLLFGSGLTAMSVGAARAYVDYAQIPPEARALIAGGNLSRLLGGIRPAPAPKVVSDPLRKAAAAGRPLPETPVRDAHCHVLHANGDGAGAYVMYRGDAEGLVDLKDVLGIRQTAIMSWLGPVASDPDSNDIVAEACRRHPDRFVGLVSINPTHQTRTALIAEIRQRVEHQGFVGLKPYPRLGLAYNDPLFEPCWEYANRSGLYVLLHIDVGPIPTVVGDLTVRFPRIQWVIAHTGGSFAMARAVAAAMKQYQNVWAELTLTPVTNGVIEWLVAEVGDDRILFGTDAPMRDPRPQFGWVVWADLPLASRRRILGDNFARLLRGLPASGNDPAGAASLHSMWRSTTADATDSNGIKNNNP